MLLLVTGGEIATRGSRAALSATARGTRYGIEPDGFDERHDWLYRSNPLGAFADWNPRVTCRGRGDDGG